MIVITGAYGFIASNLARVLNGLGCTSLLLADDLSKSHKASNLSGVKYTQLIDRDALISYLEARTDEVRGIYHLGARTDTTEQRKEIFDTLNENYSKEIWQYCTKYQIPLVYASSAATYGDGSLGFSDDHGLIGELKPLNPYGWSKQNFDQWVLDQLHTPPHWAGLKFFNVYGPYEGHKDRMASVIFHTYHKIKNTGKMELFKSHKSAFGDGEQQRDFIHVNDIVNMCIHCMESNMTSGIYNCGTGMARSFNDLCKAVFDVLHIPLQISYIDIPSDIKETYQYYTQAEMEKLRETGYNISSTSLEQGVATYVDWLNAQQPRA